MIQKRMAMGYVVGRRFVFATFFASDDVLCETIIICVGVEVITTRLQTCHIYTSFCLFFKVCLPISNSCMRIMMMVVVNKNIDGRHRLHNTNDNNIRSSKKKNKKQIHCKHTRKHKDNIRKNIRVD